MPRPTSPRRRPPLGVRVFVAMLGFGAVLFNAALMLSDRAPGITRQIGGDVAVRLSERLDAGSRPARIATDPRLPPSDALVHIAVWAVAMVLVGLAVWTWRGLVVGAVLVWVSSVVIELAQAELTDTRERQVGDIVANTVGVAIGVAVVVGCYLAWSVCATVFGGGRRAEPAPSGRRVAERAR